METELFVHFAEIAGVFIGFGALISLRSAQVTDVHDVVYLQAVLALGVWVVFGALVPLVLVGSLTLIVLERWPDIEPALYVTALAAGVVFAGYTLLVYVLSQKHDQAPNHQGR